MFSSRAVSIRRDLSQECYIQAIAWIISDGKTVPVHQREWKVGKSFSWHYVKIVEYRVNQLVEDIEHMVTKTKNKGRSNGTSFEPFTFVRCELNAEDKKTAKIWIEENTAQLGAFIHDAVSSDYKFSLSFSSEHDTFTACLSGKEDNAINPRKTLTARHKDWIVASLTVLYKHEVIFKSGVWEQPDIDDDDGWA